MVLSVSDIEEEPANLRFLRRLVTTLTVVMILGLLTIIALFVMRFANPGTSPGPLALPDSITLPEGTIATAFTKGDDWIAIVTEDDRILIYDPEGTLLRQIEIKN